MERTDEWNETGTDRRREVVRTAAAVRHTPAAGAVRTAAAKAEERSATEDEQPRRREEEERLLRQLERPRVYQRDPCFLFLSTLFRLGVRKVRTKTSPLPRQGFLSERMTTRAFLFSAYHEPH